MDTLQNQPDETRAARLASEVARDFPESWRPQPGDVLVGEYVRRDTGTSSYDGSTVPILVLRDEAGKEWGAWVFHTVLRQQLAAKRPRVGELVAIRYEGKRQGAGGSTYHCYRVAVEREGGEWTDDLATEAVEEFASQPAPASKPDDDKIPF
jgi:hypothetical protein